MVYLGIVPIKTSTLPIPKSASSTKTFFPSFLREIAKLITMLLLPTPPLPEVMVKILVLLLLSSIVSCFSNTICLNLEAWSNIYYFPLTPILLSHPPMVPLYHLVHSGLQ